jgi:hypothetical protein
MADPKTAPKATSTRTASPKTDVKPVTKTDTGAGTKVDATVDVRSTTRASVTPSVTPPTAVRPTEPERPERQVKYGPRLGVTLNVAVVTNAFHNALASRSVRYVQYALHDRGFEPGNDRGQVDYDTRRAYAEFQDSIGERRTGVPTDHSLNVLGFDVS